MERLHGWLFHYNSLTELYEAVHRDNYEELWNGGPNVIRSSSDKTLKELIIRYDGDIELINKSI